MSEAALDAVRRLRDHIEHHERARMRTAPDPSGRRQYEPTDEDRKEREQLMQGLLAAFGFTRFQMESQLGIGRATWDRWRHMASIPHRSHLERLEQLAGDGGADIESESQQRLPAPHELLNGSPRSMGRLRLLYSTYSWPNAVLGYKEPWTDYATTTEMMLLTMRGCNLVYILSNADSWAASFMQSLVRVMGKVDAARALSKICMIEIPDAEPLGPAEILGEVGFGIFNFGTYDPNDSVGYVWIRDRTDRPPDEENPVYDARPANDQLMYYVEEKYSAQLEKAFAAIKARELENAWGPMRANKVDQLLKIPTIRF